MKQQALTVLRNSVAMGFTSGLIGNAANDSNPRFALPIQFAHRRKMRPLRCAVDAVREEVVVGRQEC